MLQAIELAQGGLGQADPNPMVGALVVRDGQVVGSGWHQRAGEPHAEILALKAAQQQSQGATLYVSLEPCAHVGRTGPCAPVVLAAGIQRVVIGLFDPDPRVSGEGIRLLREQGVEVVLAPVELQKICALQNYRFLISTQKKRASISLKYAMSLDGKVATVSGQSRWITGEQARLHVHQQRHLHQAILVGRGTFQMDDPSLNVRGIANARQPWRVIIDSLGRSSAQARAFDSAGGPLLFYTTAKVNPAWTAQMRARQAEVIEVPADEQGRVLLSEVAAHLYQRGVRSILAEGGPQVHASLIKEGLVDHVLAYIAPLFLGGQSAPGPVAGSGVFEPKAGLRLRPWRQLPLGDDWLWEGFTHLDWMPLRRPEDFSPLTADSLL